MGRTRLNLTSALAVLILAAFAQAAIERHAQDHSLQQEPANLRLIKLLRHPTFITLRLLSSPNDPSRETPSDTPGPYTEKDWIGFQLFLTQNSSENITIWNELNPYYQFRPQLLRDGDPVPYSDKAEESVRTAEKQPPSGSSAPLIMEPGHEYSADRVNLADWYESLRPGRYQLVVRKRFVWDGEWVESNPVIFEVRPRKTADAIPDNVTVHLAPSGLQPDDGRTEPYRLDANVRVTVFVENKSTQRIRVNVVDLYYANRLRLFKNDVLIPYRKDIMHLIESDNTRQVHAEPDYSLDQQTVSGLQEIRLSDWYGPLAPGIYRLIIRHRFEIEGPWTRDSAPMLFQVRGQ